MVRGNSLNIVPSASKMLRKIDPEILITSKQAAMLCDYSRRKEVMRSGIRMATELAMRPVFFVAKIAQTLPHDTWIEGLPEFLLRRAQPADALCRFTAE